MRTPDPALRVAVQAVRAELASMPTPTASAELRARWVAAVSATVPPGRPGVRHLTRTARTALGVAAAVVLAGAVLAGVVAGLPPDGRQLPARLSLHSGALAGATAVGLAGRELGPLASPERLARCLHAAGLPPTEPLGGREVLLDGRPGVLLVLPDHGDKLRLVVFDPRCSTETAAGTVLADTTVSR